MKERPILFSGPMVLALLAGTKTQTRRAVKPQPWASCLIEEGMDGEAPFIYSALHGEGPGHDVQEWRSPCTCPYGQPGDRLWVRETFVQGWDYDPVTDCIQQFDADGKKRPIKTWYRADDADIDWCDADGWEANTPWKPSIHMPRSASRITLEVTGVRAERLQDISEADAQAEGWTRRPEVSTDPQVHKEAARDWFMDLWESINGPGSWGANPWVWCVSFSRVMP